MIFFSQKETIASQEEDSLYGNLATMLRKEQKNTDHRGKN